MPGSHPDALVEKVVLPPVLAQDENLQEFYGSVEWSVRSIFTDISVGLVGTRLISVRSPGRRERSLL